MSPGLPFAAVAAGLVSAASPCVLPVIPGYLAAVSRPAAKSPDRRETMRGALGFVAGFTTVFVAMGATASVVGQLLAEHLSVVLRLAGAMLVMLGLHSLGVLRLPGIDRDRRLFNLAGARTGPSRSALLGAVFALGWTPCIGPVLATVLTKAADTGSVREGIVLLSLYSVGLGIPFLALATWSQRSERARRWLSRWSHALQRVGALTMLLVGLGYLTGV